jgi:hypothetical protein
MRDLTPLEAPLRRKSVCHIRCSSLPIDDVNGVMDASIAEHPVLAKRRGLEAFLRASKAMSLIGRRGYRDHNCHASVHAMQPAPAILVIFRETA